MGGDAGDPHPSAAELDEEQDVEALQQKRVDGEEVGGDDVGVWVPEDSSDASDQGLPAFDCACNNVGNREQ
jgi:hypothetical protein